MRVLFLCKDVIFPIDSGGRIRTYNMLKQLNKKFDLDIISVVCPGEEKYIPEMRKLCKNFVYVRSRKSSKQGLKFYLHVFRNLFSRYPYTMAHDYKRDLKRNINRIYKNYNLFICDFLFPALNCLDVKIKKVLFQHNVEFMVLKRHFQNTKGIKRLIWWLQYIKAKRMEKKITRLFNYVICVSENDVNIHRRVFGVKNTDYVDLGVDVKEYERKGFEREKKSIVFTAGLDWRPNPDGVKYFNDKIFPRLEGYKFYCVGKNPDKEIRKLNRKDFVVTGRVPDVKPYLFRGEVYAVPLRIGGGTRIKIFQAMAAKIPVVSTTIGAEGLPVTDGENILIRDSPKEFAEAIDKLSTDKKLYNRIKNNAYNLVKNNYSWEKISKKFIEICETVVGIRK